MELYLVRHTTPEVARGTTYGQADVDLKSSFLEEAESVRGRLSTVASPVYWSSPLRRCRLLAEMLSPVPPHLDDRLREIHFGQWEMKVWDVTDTGALLESLIDHSAPGGESYAEVQARGMTLVRELLAGGHSPVVLVTHAGVIRSLVAGLVGLPLRQMFRLHVGLGSVSRIDVFPDVSRLIYLNR